MRKHLGRDTRWRTIRCVLSIPVLSADMFPKASDGVVTAAFLEMDGAVEPLKTDSGTKLTRPVATTLAGCGLLA